MARRSAPDALETSRLELRRPRASDADAVFARYSSDPDVTRYVGWPTHRAVEETRAFLEYSEAEWTRWPAGPYLILTREGGRLLGGTGLSFETSRRAMTGYVLAKDVWGMGYATEALEAMVGVAKNSGVRRSMRSVITSTARRLACSKSAILLGKECCALMLSSRIFSRASRRMSPATRFSSEKI
jgi:hypothetical protein